MIEYIKGELTELTPATAVVEAGGVGYLLNISLNAYTAIQSRKEVKLFVYEAISEDAHTLFGFADKMERELFLQLLTVNGVGGNTARMIISSFTPQELANVIRTGNERLLKSVKGIGLKTAQRIIVDLKDKVGGGFGGTSGGMVGGQTSVSMGGQVMDEAISALVMLGFPSAASQKVVTAILKDTPTLTVEQVIKEALKKL